MDKISCIVPDAKLKELHRELNSGKNINRSTSPTVELYKGNWTREDVAKQTDKIFLFGDNTNDRLNTHYVPSSTQAVIRGLPNAIGIDTKKNRGTSKNSYFTDADFEEFKKQVDEAIQYAIETGKTIVIPENGIGTGKAMLEQKAPKLFAYLQNKLKELQKRESTSKVNSDPAATKFSISESSGYRQRTIENAEWSDLTLALAVDFNTAGEKLTKTAAGDKWAGLELKVISNSLAISEIALSDIASRYKGQSIKLNIAGNGIYTFNQYGISQEQVNEIVLIVIQLLRQYGVSISEIRSGGQTGVDEAGIIAAQRLGIPNEVHTTADWKFRGADGKDVKGEETFKERFSKPIDSVEETQDYTEDEVDTNKPVTVEDVMGYIREFCAQKGIEQSDWRVYEKEAEEYVRERAKGNTPEVTEATSLEVAKLTLKYIVDTFKSFVRESVDFKKDHTYYITLPDGTEVKADTTVSTFGNNLNEGKNPLSKEDIPINVGMALGNTFDSVVRDYFSGNLKKSYPNLDSDRLAMLIKSLDKLKEQFNAKFPDGYHVEANPFPIAARFQNSKGKQFTIAGEMDLLVTDSEGNLYIYDMKAISGNKGASADILRRRYENAMTLYGEIIKAQFPKLADKIKGYGLIVAKTTYLPGKISKDDVYMMDEDGQLYYSGIPIQNFSQDDYNITLTTTFVAKRGYIVPVTPNVELKNILSSLTSEELDTLSELGFDREYIQEIFNDMLAPEKTVYTDPAAQIDTNQYISPVTQAEIQQLGTTIGKYISYIVRGLQNDDSFREDIFPDEAPDSFIGETTEEILNSSNLNTIINYIRYDILGNIVGDTAPTDPRFEKYLWAVRNFDIIVQAASIELLNNTGISITGKLENEIQEDSPDINSIEGAEQTERLNYSYSTREMSVQKSMSKILKNIIATLPEVHYVKKLDEDGNYVWEEGDVEEDPVWGMTKFLDRDTTISTLLDKLHNARTIEEMMDRLLDENNVNQYPWFPEIYDLLEENPSLKPVFYSTFRKNRTIYVRTAASINYEYDPKTKETTPNVSIRNFNLVENEIKSRIKSECIRCMLSGEASLFRLIKNSATGHVMVNQEKVEELYDLLDDALSRKTKRKAAMLNALEEALEAIGFKGYREVLHSVINKKIFRSIYDVVKDYVQRSRKYIKPVVPFNDITVNYSNLFNNIANLLTVIAPYKYDISVYDGGKTYQVYTLPSFLGDLIDSLSDYREEDYGESIRTFIENKYGWSYQTSYTDSNGIGHYISSWLETLRKDPTSGKELLHLVEVSSMDKKYSKMNTRDYALSLLEEYFAPESDYSLQPGKYARYGVPTMSDKPASEFIQFYKHSFLIGSVEEAKDDLAEEAAPFVLMEINRMKRVLWEAVNGGTKVDVYSPNIPEKVLEKLRKRAKNKRAVKLNFDDILNSDGSLQDWMKTGGMGFRFFPFFNEELRRRSVFAQDILNFLSNQPSESYGINLMQDIKEIFKEKMEIKFQEHLKYLRENTLLNADDPYLKAIIPFGYKSIEQALEEYYWNSTVGKANILSMTIIDPAFYDDSVQVQKRFAQVHSMTEKCDVSATFIDKDGVERNLSDGVHRYIIIEDRMMTSELGKAAERLYDSVIAKTTDSARRKWLMKQKKLAMKAFTKVNETDGQAFTSPEGYMKKIGMMEVLTPEMQKTLEDIAEGKNDIENLYTPAQTFKPFVFTWERVASKYGDWIVPVQLKDSEELLYLSGDILKSMIEQGIVEENSPLAALFKVLHESAYTDGVWNGSGIDTVVFHSAVKTGGYNIIPDLYSVENPEETLREYIAEGYVHEHPFYDWGRQQHTPAEYQDHTQAMPTQTRAISVSDLSSEDRTPDGRTVGEVRKEYFNDIHEDMETGYSEAEELFQTNGTRESQVERKSSLLKEALQKDGRTTFEELKAISLINGEFNVPLGDPIRSERYSSVIFSAIKSRVNKEAIPGGPIVQTTSWGYVSPKIVFKENGEIDHIGVYVTCPSAKFERRITKKDGSLMSVEEIIAKRILPEEALYGITSRVPVENKYSIFPMKIQGFLPRAIGEKMIFPSEVTVINGGDFDIDKAFPELKFSSWGNKKLTERQKLKDRIINGQYLLLTTQEGSAFILSPQDISELKALALELDPLYKENQFSMTDPTASLYFQHQNMIGKAMVAVSASTNVAHTLLSMCNIGIKAPSLIFNGVSLESLADSDGYTTLDPVWSPIDGSLISRYTGALVGASADCAKDPVIASIGYNLTTANLFTGLLRIGVPIRTVSLMMSQKVVKNISFLIESNGNSLSEAFHKYLVEVCEDKGLSIQDLMEIVSSEDFTEKKLKKNLENPDSDMDLKIIGALFMFNPYADAIFKISQIVNLNSAQNSVGPSSYDTLKKMIFIEEFFSILDDGISDPTDIKNRLMIFGEATREKLYDNLPFLDTLIKTYTELVPTVMGDDFLIFSNTTLGLIRFMRSLRIPIGSMSKKQLKNLINDFMIYMFTGELNGVRIIDASFKERQRILYDTPIDIVRSSRSIYNKFTNLLQFKERASKKEAIPSISMDTSKFPAELRDQLSAAWAALVNPDNSNVDMTGKLSDDLMTYNIMKFGFLFSPMGFLNLAPNAVKHSYKGGIYEIFSDAKNWRERLTEEDYYNFLLQRVRNNMYNNESVEIMSAKTFNANTVADRNNKDIRIVKNDVYLSQGTLAIRVKNKLYLRIDPKSRAFVEVTSLGFNNQGREYNRNESALSMKTVKSYKYYKQLMKDLKEAETEEDSSYGDSFDESEGDEFMDKRTDSGWGSYSDLLNDVSFLDWTDNMTSEESDIILKEKESDVLSVINDNLKKKLGGDKYKQLRENIKKFIEKKNICRSKK